MKKLRSVLLLASTILLAGNELHGQFVDELSSPNWKIILDAFGYSDLALDRRTGFEGREYLSGEWAAAVKYTDGSVPHGPVWLPPEFTYPDWTSNSDFDVESWNFVEQTNSYGLPVMQSVITNPVLRITITAEMIDTTNGIAQGLSPRSAAAGSNGISDRYVFRQRYQVQNKSGRQLSAVKFYKFLHSLEASRAVYDDRAYPATINGHRYTITERGSSVGGVGYSGIGAAHQDTVSLHANIQPCAWEVGHYGKESIDDHAMDKPQSGVHLSVEADSLSNADWFEPAELWVSGAMAFDLGVLAANATTNLEFLLSIQTDSVVQQTRVVAWGDNRAGQTNVPPDLTNIIAVAAGANHSLALRWDGTVVAWGDNTYGQCSVPAGLRNVSAIAAGARHNLALREDGSVVAWGDNRAGQTNVTANVVRADAIAAGGSHSLALLYDGTLAAWGDNSRGQLYVPSGFIFEISAGEYHSIASGSFDDLVLAWGDNQKGQLNVPLDLFGPYAIAAGYNHNIALDWDGTVRAWGDNSFGQTDVPSDLPEPDRIAAGGDHSFVIGYDGAVVGWGRNSSGQCDVPPGIGKVLEIAAGGEHSLALVLIPPQLSIGLSGGLLEIGWSAAWSPGWADIFVEKAASPNNPVWQPVTLQPVLVGTQYKLRLPFEGRTQFYRFGIR